MEDFHTLKLGEQDIPVVPSDFADEESALKFTQGVRRMQVKHLTRLGSVPSDKDDRQALELALSGIERVSIGKLRIKAEEKTGAALAGSAATVAELLREMSKGGHNRAVEVLEGEVVSAPELGSEVPRPTLVDGELDIVTKQQSYETLMRPGSKPE